MLSFIDSTGEVLAIEVSGKITGDDLEAIMDVLDRTLATHDKVHVFVETRAIGGLELTSLPDQVWLDGRAQPMRSRQTELRDRYLK